MTITAAMNALRQIREARKSLQEQQNQLSLDTRERELVEEAICVLADEEDIIINNSIDAMVDLLDSKNKSLLDLVTQMNKLSDKIDGISQTIKKIADVVGVLTEITAKAISAGLI